MMLIMIFIVSQNQTLMQMQSLSKTLQQQSTQPHFLFKFMNFFENVNLT